MHMRLPNINTWQHLFVKRILERGYDYYVSGRIQQVQKTKHGWTAAANGSETYHVQVVLSGHKVTEVHCTCPYAADGSHCKHEAALLYQIFEEKDPVHPELRLPEPIEDILDRMSETELRQELKRIASSQPLQEMHIRERYGLTGTAEDPADDIETALDLLGEEYSDRDGNISWREGQDYADAFCGTLKEHLEPLLEAERYEAAVHCLARAFTVINNVELDGSFGEYSYIEDVMVHYWDRVIRSVSSEDRKQIHGWLEAVNEEASYLNCSDVIDTVLKKSFDDPEYLEPLLNEVKQKLDDPDLPEHRVKELLERLKDLLLRSGKDGNDYDRYLSRYNDYPAVKEIRLAQARSNQDTEEEIRILEELVAANHYEWDPHGYRDTLLECYEAQGQTNREKAFLQELLMNQGVESADLLRKLRSLCNPKYWPKVRDFYLSSHSCMKLEIYAEEGEYEKLLESMNGRPIEEINRYRDILIEKFPNEMRKIYMDYLLALEEQYTSAAVNNQMKEYLPVLASIKGGRTDAMRLIDRWKRQYPSRKDMQEMLGDVTKKLNEMEEQ